MSNNEINITNLFDTQTRTELHTHLLSMLSGENFVKLFNKYKPALKELLRINNVSNKVRNNIEPYLTMTDEELKNALTIYTEIKDGQTMSDYFVPRRLLLSIFSTAGEEFTKFILLCIAQGIDYPRETFNYFKYYNPNKLTDKESIDAFIYSEYLNIALEELISQGVKYVEISFANLRIIQNIYIKESIREQIECRFMLCTNRDNLAFIYDPSSKNRNERKANNFAKDSAPALTRGLEWSHEQALAGALQGKQKNIVGFDIMGQELPFRDDELSRSPESEVSFYNKLKIIIDVLQKDYILSHTMNTFRIHGGETRGSEDNIYQTLKMLKELAPQTALGIIPPPEIRIGHGVYFNDTKEYFDLLRKFDVVVEINASSNKKLRNIDHEKTIRYKRYIEERIPIVIATDGHGLYDTTIQHEDDIAISQIGDSFNVVLATDELMLSTKKRR